MLPTLVRRVLALALILAAGAASPATAAPPDQPGTRAAEWYLALGDSLAAGTQLGMAEPTAGFAGPVVAALDADHQTQLRNLGCPGETSTTLVDGGKCTYDRGTQLAEAVGFLRAHDERVRLVTLTVGANDVTSCLSQADPATCVQQRLVVLRSNVQRILGDVRAAAPDAQVVVTNYYNPYLAAWFTNKPLATLTMQLQAGLNGVIAGLASSYDADVADVSTAFHSFDTTLVGGVPVNVATICRLTWMCSNGNIHANADGYAAMAEAIVATLH